MKRYTLDVECYNNWYLAGAREAGTENWYIYEVLDGEVLQGTLEGLQEIVTQNAIVTFNGFGYDHALVSGALSGFDHAELFALSQHMVKGDQLTPWQVWNDVPGLMKFDFKIHIDLMAIAPLIASLKMYSARIGFRKIQELPLDWRKAITREDRDTMLPYWRNDIEATEHLYDYLRPQVLLRKDLNTKYRMDLYQKSDAQIAEAVIKSELKLLGIDAKKKKYTAKPEYMYTAPAWLSFDTPELQDQLVAVQEAKFKMQTNGKFKLPKILEKPLKLFGHSFQMGSGGLHSQEANRSVVVEDGWQLSDIDVASMYPNMILNNEYAPENFREEFLQVYRKLVNDRITAKGKAGKLKKRLKELEKEREKAMG